MELRAIRSLVVLAEVGSITKTASRLGLTAAAVHKQLKTLEADFGSKVYEKKGDRLRPTEIGQALLPHCKTLLNAYEAAVRSVYELRVGTHGTLRLGGTPSICADLLPALLKRYRKDYPDVEIFIESGAGHYLLEALNHGDLDLVFFIAGEPAVEKGFQVEASWSIEYVLVDQGKSKPRTCSIMDLERHRFILYKKLTTGLIDRYFESLNFKPRVTMRFDHTEGMKSLTKSGMGISVLPFFMVEDDLKKGTLSLIQQSEDPLFLNMLLIRNPTIVSKPITKFIDLAKDFTFKQTLTRQASTKTSPLRRAQPRGQSGRRKLVS